MELNAILQAAVRAEASDIHLKAGLPPVLRIHGGLFPLKDAPRLSPEDIGRMALGLMNAHHKERFKKNLDIDLAYSVPNVGRFRVNVYQQRGVIGMVFRAISSQVKTIEELFLPPVLEKIALQPRGLVLVTGATGSGKSTTLAAMIETINRNRSVHILTIEDPIEFLLRDRRSIINQREVGTDVPSFASGLRAALRQDPDVILIGEMRDLDTIEAALTAAETGHLVLSTLHTINASETVTRIVTAFPPHHQARVRRQVAGVVEAIISQRLVPRADGRGRVPALEILRATARVRELLEDEARQRELPDAIAKGTTPYGMQTFDQSLMFLLRNGYITYEEALSQCSNPDDFALRVSGVQSGAGASEWDSFENKEGG